jgi:UDP-glucuronate 4-epimerase
MVYVMKILVTGAAGFIGFHTTQKLLDRGDAVIGIDNLNNYYDPALKQARLDQLIGRDGFTFIKGDLADQDTVAKIFADEKPDMVVHLAAQPGVRYSLENPHAYIQSNIVGHLNILEGCRHSDTVQKLVYASSSSVYGGNTKQPFSVDDPVDHPVSLYAATKKSDELMSHCYAHLYGIKAVGLRFFTVYGPWGRPDMATDIFINAISRGEPIKVFNNGDMRRDFTFIDDIVSGILGVMGLDMKHDDRGVYHSVYNLGNNRSEDLSDYIAEIEKAVGKDAIKEFMPMQPGDVKETYADIDASRRDFGYDPQTPISKGIPKVVEWYKDFYKV